MPFRQIILIVTGLFAGMVAADEPTMAELGQLDQAALRESFYEKYTPYLNAYIGLYVANEACKYEFIDEAHFNELADSVIKQAVKDVDSGLRQAKLAAVREDASLRDYLANMLAFAMLDAQSQVITASQPEEFRDPGQCKESQERIQANYELLRSMASSIVGGG